MSPRPALLVARLLFSQLDALAQLFQLRCWAGCVFFGGFPTSNVSAGADWATLQHALRARFESTRHTTSRHSVWWREKSVKADKLVCTDVCCCKHVWADWRPWTYQVFVPNYSRLRTVCSAEAPDNPGNLVACRLMACRGPQMLPGMGQDSQLDSRAVEDDWLLSDHITAPWPATCALLSDLHDGSSKCLDSELGQYRIETCKVTVATRPAVLRTSCESRKKLRLLPIISRRKL